MRILIVCGEYFNSSICRSDPSSRLPSWLTAPVRKRKRSSGVCDKRIESAISNPIESIDHVTEELAEVGVELTMNQAEELMRLIMELRNNSRQWCISGWKPVELAQRYKPQGKPAISFGPGIQQAFANGDMDREEMVRQLRAMGLNMEE